MAAADADAEATEILFLKDRVCPLQMQLSILQKHLDKQGKNPRYTVCQRLLILRHMEAFQIQRRKVSLYFGIARSTFYRRLHTIEGQEPSGTPAKRTPAEIASLVWEITKANLRGGRIRIASQLKSPVIFLSASDGSIHPSAAGRSDRAASCRPRNASPIASGLTTQGR